MLSSVAYVGDRNTPSMPPCPCQRTAGTLSIGVFCPFWVTSQTGPTFSVTSMRPSGRKARRQGRVKVVTVVSVKGRIVSDFCSPALTWPQAAADARVSSNIAFANCIVIPPLLLKHPILRHPGALVPIVYARIEILSEFAPSVVEDDAPGVVAVNLGSCPCNGGP